MLLLEAPVLRVGAFDTPYPPSRVEEDYLPDATASSTPSTAFAFPDPGLQDMPVQRRPTSARGLTGGRDRRLAREGRRRRRDQPGRRRIETAESMWRRLNPTGRVSAILVPGQQDGSRSAPDRLAIGEPAAAARARWNRPLQPGRLRRRERSRWWWGTQQGRPWTGPPGPQGRPVPRPRMQAQAAFGSGASPLVEAGDDAIGTPVPSTPGDGTCGLHGVMRWPPPVRKVRQGPRRRHRHAHPTGPNGTVSRTRVESAAAGTSSQAGADAAEVFEAARWRSRHLNHRQAGAAQASQRACAR